MYYKLGGATILFAKCTSLERESIEHLLARYFRGRESHLEGAFIFVGKHGKTKARPAAHHKSQGVQTSKKE